MLPIVARFGPFSSFRWQQIDNRSEVKIGGPFLNRARRNAPLKWYLSYFVPKLDEEGQPVLRENGRPVMERKRPYYASKEIAQADKPRLLAQHGAAGSGAAAFHSRADIDDLTAARALVPDVPFLELARFWRRHHPVEATPKLAALLQPFLAETEARLGKDHHLRDLKARVGAFVRAFADRLPDTLQRQEVLDYFFSLQKAGLEGRTIWNHSRGVSNFLSWLVEKKHASSNPIAGLKRRHLPKFTAKEIRFLSLEEVECYLRTLERYDPELVAHEVIQLFSGVRADGEMADFRGEWVLPETREIVIPAEIAKTERREVIGELEDNFWLWWAEYGRPGLLRPRSYAKRWERIRYLTTVTDPARRDELARLRLEDIQHLPDRKARLAGWPYNARRRTFCTYHVAKHQSAAKTALILRHRGSAYSLHNSYRGTGVTREQGQAYFDLAPQRDSLCPLA